MAWLHDNTTFGTNQQNFLQAHNGHIANARRLMSLFHKIELWAFPKYLASAWQVHGDCFTTFCSHAIRHVVAQLEHNHMTSR